MSPWDVIPYCFFEIKNIFCLILCVWWLSWYILASAFFCYTPALQIKTHPSKCKRDVKKHSEATPLRKKKGQDAPEWELAEEWVFFTNIIHGRMLTPLSVSVKNKAISWWMRGYGRNKEGDCQDSLIFKRVKNINNKRITKPFSPYYERLSWRETFDRRAYFFSWGMLL